MPRDASVCPDVSGGEHLYSHFAAFESIRDRPLGNAPFGRETFLEQENENKALLGEEGFWEGMKDPSFALMQFIFPQQLCSTVKVGLLMRKCRNLGMEVERKLIRVVKNLGGFCSGHNFGCLKQSFGGNWNRGRKPLQKGADSKGVWRKDSYFTDRKSEKERKLHREEMSSDLYLKHAVILICFLGMSSEGNLTMLEETQAEKSKKDLDASLCCIGKRNETEEVKFQWLGKNGGKYRIPLTRANKNLKPLKRREMDGRDDNFKIGFEDSHQGSFSPQFTTKTGSKTKVIHKRQKVFFRKNFTWERGKNKRKTIYLLGLFDLTEPKNETRNLRFKERYQEREEGRSEIWAADLAVRQVNQKRLFDGYQLELYWNDTKCDPGVAIDALFYALFSKAAPLPILLGSACSVATASLASITPYWNIVQISFGATSPVLSNRKKFPMFYRVAAPDSSHNSAKLAFIRHFGWNTVTCLSQNEKEYILTVNYFIKVLERENVTCKGTVTFGKHNYQDQLQHLKDLDTRIIFGSFSEEIAPKIFCKVFELGIYGANYAWILHGSLRRSWWKSQTECPRGGLKRAVQGVFFISNYHDPDQVHSFHSNYTSRDLKKALRQQKIPISRYAQETYDAIWTAAIALNESLRSWSQSKGGMTMEDFNYDRYDMAQTIFHKISLINAVGMSGPISFEGADRLGASAFYQLRGENLAIVATYLSADKSLNFSCDRCKDVFWEGGQAPVSQRFLLRKIETISFKAFLMIACSTVVAMFLAIMFLIFNSYFRKLKNIKLSSPKLNNIAVAGCIAVYIGVFLLGLDYATLPDANYYSVLCTAKVYFFSSGFSLAFGSIFAKTYRVHKIFIKSQGGFIKKKFLQDRQLILLVGVLLLIDGLILTVWVIFDPLQRQLYNATVEYSTVNRSVIYQTQVEICSCKHLNGWMSFLYMYKGLQLLMGVFLAWETRHVKIPGLNDSQYIVLSVYSVVITSCIVVVLTNLIFEKPTIAYLIISTMILSSTTATLCSLFFPKIKLIFSKSLDNCDPIMQSMGLIMESNTRRFVMDDAKEKLYRLEVQNKVYKREAFTLGNEIARMEKQLLALMSLHFTNSLRSSKMAKISGGFLHHSLLDISTYTAADSPRKILTSSWPSEIHTITQPDCSVSLSRGLKLEISKNNNSVAKIITGKGKMKNFFKSTINLTKKNPSGKPRKDQKKFVLSQFLPYVQKSVKSSEDLRDGSFFRKENEKFDEKWKIRRKSQPSTKVRFKGSPRFPHRIVPSSMFIEEVDKESNSMSGSGADLGEVVIHQVEVLVPSEIDE